MKILHRLVAALAVILLSASLASAQFAEQRVWGGTSGGTGNAQTLSISNYTSLQTGVPLRFVVGATNTGATTLNVSSIGATTVLKNTPLGLQPLTGGELRQNDVATVIYDGTRFVLYASSNATGPAVTIASAGTVDLGTAISKIVTVSGTTTITSFGSSATVDDPIYEVTFSGALTITHNGTSLILPNAGDNIVTVAGATATMQYLGSGNWKMLRYQPANVIATLPLCGANGLTIANNSGTPNTQIDVSASAITVVNSLGVPKTRYAVSGTINTSNTNVINGIDGTRNSTTWYHIYALDNGSSMGFYASSSATGSFSNTPSGYTFVCRLGAMQTDGSGNFYRTRQTGQFAEYQITAGTNTAAPLNINSSNTGGSYTAVTFRGNGFCTPPTATHIQFLLTGNSGTNYVIVGSNTARTHGSASNPPDLEVALPSGAQVTQKSYVMLQGDGGNYASNTTASSLLCGGWRDAVNAS